MQNKSVATSFQSDSSFNINISQKIDVYKISELNKQARLLADQETSNNIKLSSEESSIAYRNNMKKRRELIEDLPFLKLEEIEISMPRQSEISPQDSNGKSMIKNLLITKKTTAYKEGPQAEGTIFSPYLGTLNSGTSCASCQSPDCVGHHGRIIFPVKIPYHNQVGVLINICTSLCMECDTTILSESQVADLGISPSTSRITRLEMIAEASRKNICTNIVAARKGKCGSRKTYDREESKRTGFLHFTIPEAGAKKSSSMYTGDEIDEHFRNLSISAVKLLGFDHVEDLCAYLCVGVIVPPIQDRPYIESFDKFKNKDNDALATLVSCNEILKEEIAKQLARNKTMVNRNGTKEFKSEQDIRKEKRDLAENSDNATNQSSREIAHIKDEINKAQLRLRNDPEIMQAEEIILGSEARLASGRNIEQVRRDLEWATGILNSSDIRKGIKELQDRVLLVEAEYNKKSSFIKKQMEDISEKESSRVEQTKLGPIGADINRLVIDLYTAHTEYITIILKKPTGKYEAFRRQGLGKHAYYVGRGVASPGADVEPGEAQIPEYLVESLGVLEDINSLNIAEFQLMMIPGRRKITHIHRNGHDIQVTDLAVQQGEIRLIVGDQIVRHLADGDPVVVIRNPVIHIHNMYGFYAKIVPGALSIRVHMMWTTGYNLDFDGDELGLFVPQGEARAEVMSTMYAPLNVISSRSSKPIAGVVYNAISAWYLATKKKVLISQYTWDNVRLKLSSTNQLDTFHQRLMRRNIVTRTGHDLFSMLLPEDFNYPATGFPTVKGVVIESGILISGTLTSAHLSPGEPRTIIQAIYHTYGIERTEKFLGDIYIAAYAFLEEYGQTVSAEDCAYGTQVIAKLPKLAIMKNIKKRIEKETSVNLTYQEYVDLIVSFGQDLDVAREAAQYISIENDIQALGPIRALYSNEFNEEYIKIVQRYKSISREDASAYVSSIVVGPASEVEGKKKLARAEKQIQMLGEVPTDPIRRRTYEVLLVEIINGIGDVGVQAAKTVRKYVDNNLLDMASDFGAGAKGNPSNIAMMGGFVGQQQIKGSARLMPAITNNTRCITSIRPGDIELQAGGYIDNSYFEGLSPQNVFLGAVGQRESMADTVTKTATAGMFNRYACKAMENLICINGAVRNQDGQLFQYNYGEDGLFPDKMLYVDDAITFVDIAAVCDRLNYEAGWEKVTVMSEGDDVSKVINKPSELEDDLNNKMQINCNLSIELCQIVQQYTDLSLVEQKEKELDSINQELEDIVEVETSTYIAVNELRIKYLEAMERVRAVNRKRDIGNPEWEMLKEKTIEEYAQISAEYKILNDSANTNKKEERNALRYKIEQISIEIKRIKSEGVTRASIASNYVKAKQDYDQQKVILDAVQREYNEAVMERKNSLDNLIVIPRSIVREGLEYNKSTDVPYKSGISSLRRPWFLNAYKIEGEFGVPYRTLPIDMFEMLSSEIGSITL